jgi:hypothetical protein
MAKKPAFGGGKKGGKGLPNPKGSKGGKKGALC